HSPPHALLRLVCCRSSLCPAYVQLLPSPICESSGLVASQRSRTRAVRGRRRQMGGRCSMSPLQLSRSRRGCVGSAVVGGFAGSSITESMAGNRAVLRHLVPPT